MLRSEQRELIARKIGCHLTRELRDESDLISFIVLIRKSWELLGKPKDLKRLSHYCNWPLHAIMELGPSKSEVSKFLELYQALQDRKAFSPVEDQQWREILSLSDFLNQLTELLKRAAVDLNPHVCSFKWTARFVDLYLTSISSTPLTLDEKCRLILEPKKVPLRPTSPGMVYVVSMHWRAERDGSHPGLFQWDFFVPVS